MKKKVNNPKEIAEEMLWLAWNACRGSRGMGVFQDNPEASKEDVVHNVKTSGDYPVDLKNSEDNHYTADYVFGRMMKLRIDWEDGNIILPVFEPSPEFQEWASVYPSYEELLDAALKTAGE